MTLKHEEKLYYEKIKFLFSHASVNIIASAIFLLVIFFSIYDVVKNNDLLVWISLNASVLLVVYLMLFKARRSSYQTTDIFNRIILITLIISGLLFGYIGVVTAQDAGYAYQSFVLLVIGGLVAVSIGSFSVNLPFFTLYSSLMLLPMISTILLKEGEFEYLMGIVALLFYLMMLLSAIRVNKSVISALSAQFENEDLVKYLSDTKKRVEALNKNLKTEINERMVAQNDLELVTDRLSEAQEIASMGNFELDLHSKELWFSKELYELYGFEMKSPMNLERFFSVVDERDVSLLRSLVDESIALQHPFNIDYRVVVNGEEIRTLHVQTKISEDRKRGVFILSGAVQDVSEQRKKDEELLLASRVFEGVHDAVIVTDESFNVLTANSAFYAITKRDKESVVGSDEIVLAGHVHNEAFMGEFHESIKKNGFWKGELSGKSIKGKEYTQRSNVSVIKYQGKIVNYIELFSDITREKKAEERLRYLVHYDSLTGLPNRELLKDRLTLAMQKQKRSEKLVAIMLFDMDNFKLVNDTLGHIAGDGMLRLVAERLRSIIRTSDTLSRLGGDEFCLLLDDVENVNFISSMAQKILSSFEKPFIVEAQQLFMTVSIGISIYPENAADVQTLIKRADTAMYRAKDSGKNTYKFFTDQMDKNSYERLMIEGDLRRALDDGELELYYQPKVELCTGNIIGAEALLRWKHPDMGMIAPDKFINIAEDTGLIVPIGAWVMDEALRQTKEWIDEGFEKLHIAVNVSGRQFKTEDIVALVKENLERNDVSSSNLEIELTESVLMDEKEKILSTLNSLRDHGVSIAIDDFGTGYSSLSYLKIFPLTTLKIDKSFIEELEEGSDDAEIVRATIKMAKSLNMRVVAEGVETVGQLNFLQKEHCDEIQGYHYSPPVPASRFRELLENGV